MYNNANGTRAHRFQDESVRRRGLRPFIKNKLFFFTSYHFLRFNQGQNYLSTVPTDLERER